MDTYVWDDGQTQGTLLSRSETSADGLQTWTTTFPGTGPAVTLRTETVPGSSRTVTTTAPDQTSTVSAYSYGRLVSVTRYDNSGTPGNQVTRTTYSYDSHGRQSSVTDARNGATTYTYANSDQLATLTTPPPGNGQAPQTTTTLYNTSLRAWKVTYPDGTSITNEFFPTGQLKKTYGSRTYPVEYAYDAAGRMKTMTTWTNYPTSGAAVTTWNYDLYRGWLTNKTFDAGAPGPVYTNTAGGRLRSRTWARGVNTLYSYGFDGPNAKHGDLTGVTYSADPENTPAIAYEYDRRGRRTHVTQGTNQASLGYTGANLLTSEAHEAGTLNGLTVTTGYDDYLRRSSLAVNTQPSAVTATHGYNAAGQLQTVTDANNNSAAYSYLANSPLVEQIVFKRNGAPVMTTTKQFDFLNRLSSIGSINSQPSTLNSFSYSYNSANQRARRSEADGSHWTFEYDNLGQVTSGKKHWPDGAFIAGQQFEYVHDTIGNRRVSKAGGDENGINLRTNVYSPNLLNQYASRTVPGAVDAMGIALGTSTVTVDTQSPYRHGEYFRRELTVANTSTPVWKTVPVTASGETSVTRYDFVPQTPESFSYDLDGNLTGDGRWNYYCDAENRLLRMVARTAMGPQQRLQFTYDWQGRRLTKKVWDNTAGTGPLAADLKFVYDGWNLLAELNATNNHVIRSFTWGADLSGSLQGAGGVGGLLSIWDSSTLNTQPSTHFVAFDGNGNVTALVNAANGAAVAQYEYGPFGEVIRSTGTMAKANPFRFSTKYQDDESDLLYYGYRHYNASTGRWLSRDPAGEKQGLNLYEYARNACTRFTDRLGLALTAYQDGSAQPTSFYPNQGEVQLSGSTEYTFDAHLDVVPDGSKWRVKVYGQLRVNMRVGVTDQTDEEGRGALQHERVHERIDARWWNQTKSDIDGIEGLYCRKVCAEIAAEVGRTINYMNWLQSREDNVLFEMQAYPAILRQLNWFDQYENTVRQAHEAWNQWKAKYDAKNGEWDRNKCTKG